MATAKTPDDIAEKQVRRSTAALADFKAGVMAVTESPTAAAAKRVDAWFEGIQKAKSDGSYVDGCNACTLSDWQTTTTEKGGMNYVQGVTKAKATIAEFHAQRAAKQAAIDAELRAMPRGDKETNKMRMLLQVDKMAEFKFRKRRR